jgi:hypothetical protein
MSVAAARSITITYTGDVVGTETIAAAANAASPGSVTLHTLSSGLNTITLPTGGSTVTGATIVPPAGNTQTILLKGVTGDTGVGLHLTDPTSLALAAGTTTFVLTTNGIITGLRIYWS